MLASARSHINNKCFKVEIKLIKNKRKMLGIIYQNVKKFIEEKCNY